MQESGTSDEDKDISWVSKKSSEGNPACVLIHTYLLHPHTKNAQSEDNW